MRISHTIQINSTRCHVMIGEKCRVAGKNLFRAVSIKTFAYTYAVDHHPSARNSHMKSERAREGQKEEITICFAFITI